MTIKILVNIFLKYEGYFTKINNYWDGSREKIIIITAAINTFLSSATTPR
jgi:hypothetical protein